MSDYKNAEKAIKIIIGSPGAEFYFKGRLGHETMEIETPNFRKEYATRVECKMEVDKVKKPSRCFACFKPGRKLFCHTLINDISRVPSGETWLCRKCQTSFEDWRENYEAAKDEGLI